MFEKRRLQKSLQSYIEALNNCILNVDGKFVSEFRRNKTKSEVTDITWFGWLVIQGKDLLEALRVAGFSSTKLIVNALIEYVSEHQLNAIEFIGSSLRDDNFSDQTRWITNELELKLKREVIKDKETLLLLYSISQMKNEFLLGRYSLISKRPQVLAKLFINNMSDDGSLISEKTNELFKKLGKSYFIDISDQWRLKSDSPGNSKEFYIDNPEDEQAGLSSEDAYEIYKMQYRLSSKRRDGAFSLSRELCDQDEYKCFKELEAAEGDLISRFVKDAESGGLRVNYIYKKVNSCMLALAICRFISLKIRAKKFPKLQTESTQSKLIVFAAAILGYYHNYHYSYFINERRRNDDVSEIICSNLAPGDNFFVMINDYDREIPAWLWARECKEDFVDALQELSLIIFAAKSLSTQKDFSGRQIKFPGNEMYSFISAISQLTNPSPYSIFKPPGVSY